MIGDGTGDKYQTWQPREEDGGMFSCTSCLSLGCRDGKKEGVRMKINREEERVGY
jgi:hypothetical protein